MDELTLRRLTTFVGSFKKSQGRDPSHADLEKAGFATKDVDHAVRKGALAKYQATTGKGSTENRYKLKPDWRSLNP